MPDDESSSSDEEMALTRTSSAALRRLNTNLEATEQVLARSEDRYVQFFREHEEFFIQLVSRWRPIGPELLEQYADRWNWRRGLSKNNNLPWSEDLIKRYSHRWSWRELSRNEGIPWSGGLIGRCSDLGNLNWPHWDWKNLSMNESIPWTTIVRAG